MARSTRSTTTAAGTKPADGKRAASKPRPSKPRALPGARARAEAVVELLAAEYPEAATALTHGDPWELLVATILSAQTTDVRVNQVTPVLFGRWPTSAALGAAALPEVEEVVHSTGFFRAKSKAIVAMSQDVVERFGGTVPGELAALTSLRGVGRKTANVVLGSGFARPGFAVDTHVRRLTNRLRLTRSPDPVRIEQEVTALVPEREWSALSLRLILHGRRVCASRNPRCDRCILAAICPSAGIGPSVRPTRKRTAGARPPATTASRGASPTPGRRPRPPRQRAS